MRGVHVGLDFEDEAREFFVVRSDEAVGRFSRLGLRRHADVAFEEILHAEIRHGGAEEHRRELARVDFFHVKGLARLVEQLDVGHEGVVGVLSHARDGGGVIRFVDVGDARLLAVARVSGEQQDFLFAAVVDAHVLTVLPDWPVHRVRTDAEHGLDFVHEVKRSLAVVVELVDERENRDAAVGADFEELLRLRLDAFRDVDDHDGAVDGHERAVRVFGEVLMARRVEDVDAAAVVVKLEDGARDGDAALLLNLHPVGDGVALRLAGLDGAREVDGAAVEQELFRQRRLAGVRVRNDGERAPLLDFFLEFFL